MKTQPFLINPPRRRRKSKTAARKTSRRRTSARRKGVPAWVKAKGFSSWSAYMASIRPNKGGKVATRRRKRRASAARPVRRRRRRHAVAVHRAASPARRRRVYRRNPGGIRNIPGLVFKAGKNAAGVLAGKAGVRIGRAQLKIAGGTPIGFITELAIGVAGGILLERVDRNFAEMFTTGAVVSIGETLARGMNIPVLSSALGDEGAFDVPDIAGDDIAGYLNRGRGGRLHGEMGGEYEMSGEGLGGEYELAEA